MNDHVADTPTALAGLQSARALRHGDLSWRRALRALHRDGRLLAPLSPGESANAVTVGAVPDEGASPGGRGS